MTVSAPSKLEDEKTAAVLGSSGETKAVLVVEAPAGIVIGSNMVGSLNLLILVRVPRLWIKLKEWT